MVAWKSNLSAKDIQSVSSYIMTLEGTNPPDAKAAEGEIWTETAATEPAQEAVTDTNKVETPAE